jgi:hypothetical protein
MRSTSRGPISTRRFGAAALSLVALLHSIHILAETVPQRGPIDSRIRVGVDPFSWTPHG